MSRVVRDNRLSHEDLTDQQHPKQHQQQRARRRRGGRRRGEKRQRGEEPGRNVGKAPQPNNGDPATWLDEINATDQKERLICQWWWNFSESSSSFSICEGFREEDASNSNSRMSSMKHIPAAYSAREFAMDNNETEESNPVDPLKKVDEGSEEDPVLWLLKSLWKALQKRYDWKQPSSVQLHVWPRMLWTLLPPQQQQPPQQPSPSHHSHPNLPSSLPSRSLIMIAPTGSGKTLAYGLPLIATALARTTTGTAPTTRAAAGRTMAKTNNYGPKATMSPFASTQTPFGWSLVIVPTRELAHQVAKDLKRVLSCWRPPIREEQSSGPRNSHSNTIMSHKNVTILSCYGGLDNKQEQLDTVLKALHNSSDEWLLVAGTPGRLVDLFETTTTKETGTDNQKEDQLVLAGLLALIRTVVIDEADRMAVQTDLSQQVDRILDLIRTEQQLDETLLPSLCLCSATFPEKVHTKWYEWMGQRPGLLIRMDGMVVVPSFKKQKKNINADVSPDAETATVDPRDKSAVVQKMDDRDADEDVNREAAVSENVASHAAFSGSTNDPNAPEGDWLSQIPANLTQVIHVCSDHKKSRKLLTTLQKEMHQRQQQSNQNRRAPRLGIVFFNTIKSLRDAHSLLLKHQQRDNLMACTTLHSHMNQTVREASIENFRCGKAPLLLATDIAARGIHVDNVCYVIQYDFPGNLAQYVHRCGRAARGGNNITATVYGFFTRNLKPLASDLIKLLEARNQFVDPNLRLLTEDVSKRSKKERNQKRGQEQSHMKQGGLSGSNQGNMAGKSSSNAGMDDSEGDDDPFPGLSAHRIVLKRAEHVSDPSDDDSGDEDC